MKFVFELLGVTARKFINLDAGRFASEETNLFEILIKIFIDQFHLVFNKNIFSDYVKVEENCTFIKGKINFSETIKRNAFARHLHYIQYDEFTINNPLNQHLKFTILKLLRATMNSYNKKQLRLAAAYLQDVDDVTITPLPVRFILTGEIQPMNLFLIWQNYFTTTRYRV